MRSTFKADTKVYIITPTSDDRSTDRIFADEFGSLSSDSDWAPREMFNTAMRERFGDKLPAGVGFTVTLGRAEPDAKAYDIVVDLRKIKQFRLH